MGQVNDFQPLGMDIAQRSSLPTYFLSICIISYEALDLRHAPNFMSLSRTLTRQEHLLGEFLEYSPSPLQSKQNLQWEWDGVGYMLW